MSRCRAGFTLIELMIVIAVIGIIGAWVYPTYSDAVARAYRAKIVMLLMEQSQTLERFYSKKGVYRGAENLSAGNEHYRITHELEDHAFLLTATRKEGSPMARDDCGNLIVAHTGLTAIALAAPDMTVQQCWGR